MNSGIDRSLGFFRFNNFCSPSSETMGIAFSSPNIQEICKEELKASQECMKRHDYERDKYMIGCREIFQRVRDCKKKCVITNLF
jgi:hypothetical protein